MILRRTLAILACGLAGLTTFGATAHAATSPSKSKGARPVTAGPGLATKARPGSINWDQRDTAIYVVSTLNLARTPKGHTLAQSPGARRFDVFADTENVDLYFIQIHTRSGRVGVLAYEMGWAKPQSIGNFPARFGLRVAPPMVVAAYKDDPKQLIGSFNTTLPSH